MSSTGQETLVISVSVGGLDGLPRIRTQVENIISERLSKNGFVNGDFQFNVIKKEKSRKGVVLSWIRSKDTSEIIIVCPPGEPNVAYRGYLVLKKSAKEFLEGLNALKGTNNTLKDYLLEPIVQMVSKTQETSSEPPQKTAIPAPPRSVAPPSVPAPVTLPSSPVKPVAPVAKPVAPVSKIPTDPGGSFNVPNGRHKPSTEEPKKKYTPSDFTEELLAIFLQVFIALWDSKPEGAKGKPKFIMPGEFADFLNSHSLCEKGRFLEHWNAGKALTRLVDDKKIGVFKKGLKCFYTLKPDKSQTRPGKSVVHKTPNTSFVDVDLIPGIIAEHKELLGLEDQIKNREPQLDEEISQLTSEIEVLRDRLRRAKDDKDTLTRQKADLEKRKKVNYPQFEQVQKLKDALAEL